MQAGMEAQIPAQCVMTAESIASYLQSELDRGATQNALRRCRRFTAALFEWLPADKTITKERLLAWRQDLKQLGYSPDTEQNYIKGINRYLDYAGCSELRFNRGRAKDIAGRQFGYLTAIERTGEKSRKDFIWRCRCQCGKEVEYPATRLLTGNTLSCGCLRAEHLKSVNQYYDGTSLRMSMTEQVHSTRAESGYTGVARKRGSWHAYIRYKGQNISLGSYSKLEDAVKARARGKEMVQMDAAQLLNAYEQLHVNDPLRPDREQIRQLREETTPELQTVPCVRAVRSNNTSGYPGVFRRRNKWAAKLTYQKVTYQLGTFESKEQAIAARQEAESLLGKNPHGLAQCLAGKQKQE